PAPLTAVPTDQRGRSGRRPAAGPAPQPQPKVSRAGAPVPAPVAASGAAGSAAPPPPQTPDNVVAAASPNAPGLTPPSAEPSPPMQVVLPKVARFVYASYGTVRVGGFMLGVRGRTTTRWRFKDGRYQSDLSIDVVNFAESSQGHFDPDFGLEPERYSETRPHRPVSTTQFDWANRRVSFTEDSRQGEAEPGTQDRLSVQFQLAVLRQVYPERFVRGGVMPITLAGTRDVSHWTFTVTGE